MSDSLWKDRLKKEYAETKTRLSKLDITILCEEEKVLDCQLNCPLELLKAQSTAMHDYLDCLEARLAYEQEIIMASAIAKIYARRIKRGDITIEDVPEKIREEVRALLNE